MSWFGKFGLRILFAALYSLFGASFAAAQGGDSALATPEASAPPNAGLLIWWPAPIYPADKSAASDTLHQQIDTYQTNHAGITITIRVKRGDGVGGIYETLRSGSALAPSAMPDLVLLRRDDLVQAVSGKLIQVITGVSTDDLYGAALGKVADAQYGIPYVLETQHFVYHKAALDSSAHKLSDLAAAKLVMLFPANARIDTTIIAQYIAAGGHVTTPKGVPTLDSEPLNLVLSYYERAAAAKLVTLQVIDYTSISQYWSQFVGDQAAVAQVDSTTYLANRATLTDTEIMPLPTLDGSSLTTLDGWMWVIVTTDPDRQAKALDLVTWLMGADRQSAFTESMGVLPSGRTALKTWGNDGTDRYATFSAALLDGQITPFPDTIPAIVMDAVQKAFEAVIANRQTAQIAANDAVQQVTGGH